MPTCRLVVLVVRFVSACPSWGVGAVAAVVGCAGRGSGTGAVAPLAGPCVGVGAWPAGHL